MGQVRGGFGWNLSIGTTRHALVSRPGTSCIPEPVSSSTAEGVIYVADLYWACSQVLCEACCVFIQKSMDKGLQCARDAVRSKEDMDLEEVR